MLYATALWRPCQAEKQSSYIYGHSEPQTVKRLFPARCVAEVVSIGAYSKQTGTWTARLKVKNCDGPSVFFLLFFPCLVQIVSF